MRKTFSETDIKSIAKELNLKLCKLSNCIILLKDTKGLLNLPFQISNRNVEIFEFKENNYNYSGGYFLKDYVDRIDEDGVFTYNIFNEYKNFYDCIKIGHYVERRFKELQEKEKLKKTTKGFLKWKFHF